MALQNIDAKLKEANCGFGKVLKAFLITIYGLKGPNRDPKLTFTYSFHPRNTLFFFFVIIKHVKISGKCSCTVFNKCRNLPQSEVVAWLMEKVHQITGFEKSK